MTEPDRKDDVAVTFTDWLGLTDAPRWWLARPLGADVGAVLALFVLVALPFAMLATWAVMYGTARDVLTNEAAGPNLGAGALIAAILGAPFLIWSTVLKHQTLRYQKEGHITDRINKAVEQLGAEKKIDRIGRPVTVWTGKPQYLTYFFKRGEKPSPPERAVLSSREPSQHFDEQDQDFSVGHDFEYRIWPSERTEIEWRNTSFEVGKDEHIASRGDWQAFAETVPNIEVRIGAILSLERIAQDSTKYDKGRDHVRVMEILCAYIRENAPAALANDHDFGEWVPLKEFPTAEERAAHLALRQERFGSFFWEGKV